jgi:hypothetical protein
MVVRIVATKQIALHSKKPLPSVRSWLFYLSISIQEGQTVPKITSKFYIPCSLSDIPSVRIHYTSTTIFGALGALGGTGTVGGGGGGILGTACSLSGCTEGAAGAGGAGGAGGSGGTAFISTGGGGGGGTFSFFTCANTKQAEHMAIVAKEILFIIKWF